MQERAGAAFIQRMGIRQGFHKTEWLRVSFYNVGNQVSRGNPITQGYYLTTTYFLTNDKKPRNGTVKPLQELRPRRVRFQF